MSSSKASPGCKQADPASAFLSTVGDMVAAGRAYFQSTFDDATAEGRTFYDQMAADAGEAIEHFKASKSPLDVIAVQQAWLASRAKAYMEVGCRFLQEHPALEDGSRPAFKPDDAARK